MPNFNLLVAVFLRRYFLSAVYFFRRQCRASASIQGGELVSLTVLTGIHSETTVRNKSFQVSQYSSMFSEKSSVKRKVLQWARQGEVPSFIVVDFAAYRFCSMKLYSHREINNIMVWRKSPHSQAVCRNTFDYFTTIAQNKIKFCFQRYGLDCQRTELGSCLPLSHKNYHAQLHFLQCWQEVNPSSPRLECWNRQLLTHN